MGRINVLSEALINKIAAGEVVERPASVIKELVENAVDAESRVVRVELREGGLSFIRVTDDGVGMSEEDAILSLTRHATSKLRDAEGLFQILTKGFRGEALPAIASVSRFTLTTTERGAAFGTRVVVEGGKTLSVEKVAPVEGTCIEVEDLFYSVPARRKFLKREQTELAHCEEALVRIALAHPEVGFFLEHEERPLFSSPACTHEPRERVAAVLGANAQPHLLKIDEQWLGIRVQGFIATSEFTLPTARGLYCFVNRRYVRDRGLISSVQRGYLDTLPPGRQPVVVLFIDIDPAIVDVNVHPQKLEVRFSDSKGVYDAVYSAVSKATREHLTQGGLPSLPSSLEAQAHYAQAVERFLMKAQTTGHEMPLGVSDSAHPVWAMPSGEVRGFGQALPQINEAAPPHFFSNLMFLGCLGRRFWICEGQGGTLVVLDPHAVLERLYLEELLQGPRGDVRQQQKSLFRATCEVPPAIFQKLQERLEVLASWGLTVEVFGNNAFVVSAAPTWLEGAPWTSILTQVADSLGEVNEPAMGGAASLVACEAAKRHTADRLWTVEEVRTLLARLDEVSFDVKARHGRMVLSQLPFLDLVKRSEAVF